MKVGYFYWGYLGDKKFNSAGEEVSTPDGNAFYSWSIIKALQDKDNDVVLFSDRDAIGYSMLGKYLFASFAQDARNDAYRKCLGREAWDADLDYAIIEWRWDIPGRNDMQTKESNPGAYQPDRELMFDAIKRCNDYGIPFVVFDLDYKLMKEDLSEYGIKNIIELGNKWMKYDNVNSMRVQIPFDFNYIDEFSPKMNGFDADVIYIGNRYERDWCIDKYLPEGTVVHGNWLEPGHGDSANEWPHITFRKRLSASEIAEPYRNAVSTVLLAKRAYCEMGFMTARVQEAVFYGTVPFFIEEYGVNTIKQYAGAYAKFLTVSSAEEVSEKVNMLKAMPDFREEVILYMRKHLRFMDSKFFVKDIEMLLGI